MGVLGDAGIGGIVVLSPVPLTLGHIVGAEATGGGWYPAWPGGGGGFEEALIRQRGPESIWKPRDIMRIDEADRGEPVGARWRETGEPLVEGLINGGVVELIVGGRGR